MKIIRKYCIGFCATLMVLKAQTQDWDVYLQKYDLGPGSIVVDLSLIEKAPLDSMPFIIITGVKFNKCTEEGLPQTDEFENLYRISDSIGSVINKVKGKALAGIFTYQCKRLDYYYVSDTLGLSFQIAECYKRNFPKYEFHLSINHEPSWVSYTEFLYPNKPILLYLTNRKQVAEFEQKGDSVNKARKVNHWIYFPTEKSRLEFIQIASNKGFNIENIQRVSESRLPYQIHISRIDKIELQTITEITLELRKQAFRLGGEYDGWETEMAK
jgi:DNA-binding transcriptional MerR regulator